MAEPASLTARWVEREKGKPPSPSLPLSPLLPASSWLLLTLPPASTGGYCLFSPLSLTQAESVLSRQVTIINQLEPWLHFHSCCAFVSSLTAGWPPPLPRFDLGSTRTSAHSHCSLVCRWPDPALPLFSLWPSKYLPPPPPACSFSLHKAYTFWVFSQ